MKIDFDKMINIYGIECVNILMDNMESVSMNIKHLYNLGFNDIEDILVRFPFLFIKSNDEFIKIFNELSYMYGINIVEMIENDLEILEQYNN